MRIVYSPYKGLLIRSSIVCLSATILDQWPYKALSRSQADRCCMKSELLRGAAAKSSVSFTALVRCLELSELVTVK